MYKVNDTVMYGAHGACRVTGITKRKICGKDADYYVLSPSDGGSCTVYVPVGSETAEKKMRRLLSADEILEIIRSMPDEDTLWIDNENERKERYKQILSSGDRVELVKMIKAIYEHKQQCKANGKKLHISDERFFKDAEKILYNEFAAVLNINQSEVISFITEYIDGKNASC